MSQGSSIALWDNENPHVRRCHPNGGHHLCVLSELRVMLGHLPCFLQVPPTCPATTSKDTPIQRWRDSSTCLQQPPLSLPEASGKETSPGSLSEQVWPEQPVSPCHDVRLSLPARSRRTGGGCIAWCHTAAPAGTVQPTQLSSPSHHPARPPGAAQSRTQRSGQAGTEARCTPTLSKSWEAPARESAGKEAPGR